MIPGGIADKLGNRYEAKWLVRCLMDVLANKAQWLTFESVETEYEGFEFAIGRGGVNEWHQTKMNAPTGNWTINALKKEGVLRAFSKRFLVDQNCRCFFVSQDNAKDFRTLTEKAGIANSSDQFVEILSEDQKHYYEQLKEEWRQPDEIIFNWLSRSCVEIIPERELDSLNESYGDLYFYSSGKFAFPSLRDILETNLNKTLTVESTRNSVSEQGVLKFKEWAFDPTIQQRLNEETQAYLRTYMPFGAGGEMITRDQSAALLGDMLNADGPELILLTGIAGSGKSGVVRSVIERLRGLKAPHLAFRVDHYLSCSTREELGKKLTGREESPVSTLKGTFPSATSVLFVDQIDAVSEVSGRDGLVKEVIFRMITDARIFGGVKVIVVCRTFDLDSDPRLRSLKEANRTRVIEVPLFDWKADVEPFLRTKGVNVDSLNEPQRRLLCLPINLAVFLEINDPEFFFDSLSGLHERLIEKKQRLVSQKWKPLWSLMEPLKAICDWMSQQQQLTAPTSILDNYANAVDILSSEALITSSRGVVNFFHESLFDHVYARSFVHSDKNLVDLLTATEQHLFRRTQVRQILEALRQSNINRYLTELQAVLVSNEIRFHIKTAVSQWLSSVNEPTEQEFQVISRFNGPTGKFHQFFRYAALSTHTWFDLLDRKGWIRVQIEGSDMDRAEAALWWLSTIAGERPREIAELLRSWWGNDRERGGRLLNWFGFMGQRKHDDDLLLLCEDVVTSRPGNLFLEEGQDHATMLLYSLGDKSPEHCGRIIHALFDAWFLLRPNRNPFERDELKAIDIHSLSDIAKKAPEAFLQGTTDALMRSIEMVVNEGEAGENWYHFARRTFSGYRFGFDEFLGIYRSALEKIARENPDLAVDCLNKMDPHKHSCFMRLHLQSIQANPANLASHLPALAGDRLVFDSGWHGADWLSFADACREALPHLDRKGRDLIERRILDYAPELDMAKFVLRRIKEEGEAAPWLTKKSVIHDLNRSGYEQWCIFETIGEGFLGATARLRLRELRRKFPKAKIPEPDHMEAHTVGSPIKRPQCEQMKDRDWLAAIKRYDSDDWRRHGRDFIDGGAHQLAGELREATKKDPARFSNLSLQIPDTAHRSYIADILWGLAEAEASHESLAKVIRRAHQQPQRPFGQEIARLIEKHPRVCCDPEILQILLWIALNGKADESEDSDEKSVNDQTLTVDALLGPSHSLVIRGINGARGQAWEAIGRVLWEVPEAEEQAWNTIETATRKEEWVSVRCCMMYPLTPLFNMNKERFSQCIRQLIILPNGKLDPKRLSPLTTHACLHLFPYMFYWLPGLARDLVAELLSSGDRAKELIGAWLIFWESFRNDAYISEADKLTAVTVEHRRLMADVAAKAMTWSDNGNRAETLLKSFFFDDDAEVRKHAAHVFGQIRPDEVEKHKELNDLFLRSPAFKDNSFAILHMLENATSDVLDLVLGAAQTVVDEIMKTGERHGSHGTVLHQLQGLLKREYASSESSPIARRSILNMIDLMLAHEIYGVADIVAVHDRW